MESLPREIAGDILSRLPVTSLVNVKFVCRSWRKLLQDSSLLVFMLFLRTTKKDPCLILHSVHPIKHYVADFPSDDSTPNQLYVADFSSDGDRIEVVKKIRVPTLSDSKLFIYNPFTMDVLALPDSAQYPNQQVVVGFGFSSMENDYKVVKIVYYSHRGSIRPSGGNLPQSSVEILSLRSLTWRSLGEIPYQIFGKRPSQVLVNGRLNWAIGLYTGAVQLKFYEVPRPDCGSLDKFNHNLVVLGGCLSASVYRKDGYFEIWVMKEYNVKESWINLYNIDIMDQSFENSGLHLKRSYARVICLLKNGEILLEMTITRVLLSFDPKSKTFKHLAFHGLPRWYETIVHVGSLHWIDTHVVAT
ncbi:hypothetical protein POPTR_013G053301v4 [Populus trichocarpa]|uniref:Uncharacterized protein n=1 Tax=Populus trichocarpa TaxID=3694 RepID=A0ACC0S184_POPTR|nr:hypothetical protein POPTR_013G053301v4 [Populus trichocarpa]